MYAFCRVSMMPLVFGAYSSHSNDLSTPCAMRNSTHKGAWTMFQAGLAPMQLPGVALEYWQPSILFSVY